VSKCRGELELGLCMIPVIAKRMPLRSADFRFENVFGRKIHRKLAPRSGILFASTEVAPRSHYLRRVSIQKPASLISQLSRRQNGSIFQNTNL